MISLLLDTDTLIDYLRGIPPAVTFLTDHESEIVLSSVTVAELYAGVRDGEETVRLGELVELFPIIPVDLEIARAAGTHRRDFGPSHNTGLADAMIAATAETRGLRLQTLDVRHYPMIPGLKPPYERPAVT